MTFDKDAIIGKPTSAATLQVERGPVSQFAKAVTDHNPIYHNLDAAKAAGFDSIPLPPTYTFSVGHWGKFAEQQPEDPTGGVNAMHTLMGELLADGGLVLHGEQEFIYHKPAEVGNTLHEDGKITDVYTKEAKGKTMTFCVMETVFKNDAGDPVVTERFNLIHRK